MKIYNFSNISKVFFCNGLLNNSNSFLKGLQRGMKKGIEVPVHPKEIERQNRINGKRNKWCGVGIGTPYSKKNIRNGNGSLDNSVIFVSGAFGLGTKDDSFFIELFEKINELASKNNSVVVFIRGCSDNPAYFPSDKFNFSNVILAEDYSVMKLNGFDCLCVGGDIPIDRLWRINQEKRIGRKLYFDDSATKPNKENLAEIVKNNNISLVITSSAPTFSIPSIADSAGEKWPEIDKDLIKDITAQRLVIDGIYESFLTENKKPYVWCYGSNIDDGITINKIRYVSSSSSVTPLDLNNQCECAFGINLAGKSEKKVSLSSKFKRKTPSYANIVSPYLSDSFGIPEIMPVSRDIIEDINLYEPEHWEIEADAART